jgi:hypothetical protein
MEDLKEIPHRIKPGMCPVNGIRDLVHWRTGKDFSNEFIWGLGLGGGFTYLRIKVADPPRQIYWGNAGPRQHRYLAELFNADFEAIENRSFKCSWQKATEAVDKGIPPVLGPLDMYYLHFYEEIYHRRHIPIHYLLLINYDDENAYFLDTGIKEIQTVALDELQNAWNVNVPGLGKRNRLVVFDVPQVIQSAEELIRRSIAEECRIMLNPPVNMLGIPAMKKVSKEIINWPNELGKEKTAKCLNQVREYLNSPPDLTGNHLTAGRELYISFLEDAETLSGIGFSEAVVCLKRSLEVIPKLADDLKNENLKGAAGRFICISDLETKAFSFLKEVINKH